MMNQKIFEEAIRIISGRRIQAKAENERRYNEIHKKIPEIAEINYQLAQTSLRIIAGEDIEIIKRQNLQAQKYCSQLLMNHGYPEDYLDMHYTCPKCFDTGYSQGRYCTCLEKLITSLNAAQMSQNAQLKLCTFDQFRLDYYLNVTKTDSTGKEVNCYKYMEKVLNFCKQYANNFSLHSPSLLFFGKAGVGKTHLSLSIVTEVLHQCHEVIYDSVGNLLSRVEYEHFHNSEQDSDTLGLLLRVDLLVLDDLGTEFQTSFQLSTIYNIINTRINQGLPTIISTNLTHKELSDTYEPRILSRLFAVYESIEFLGPDIRLKKKQNSQPLF